MPPRYASAAPLLLDDACYGYARAADVMLRASRAVHAIRAYYYFAMILLPPRHAAAAAATRDIARCLRYIILRHADCCTR